MPPLVERLIGIALIIASLIGLCINTIALTYVPRVENAAQVRVTETLTTLSETLVTTHEGLRIVDQSLDNAAITMSTVEATTRSVSQALGDTVPLTTEMADIAGRQLPTSIAATQLALEAAEVGATSVETMLSALNTSLAFLCGIPVYEPEIPLAVTLRTVATSLEPLPESLGEIEQNIVVSGNNLRQIERDVDTLASNLEEISTALDDAKQVTAQYEEVVEEQQAIVEDLLENSDTWITWGARVVLALLIWLAIAQLGLLSQGIEMVLRSRNRL